MKLQYNFVFVDTESYINPFIEKKQKLTFRLGCVIYWNRITNRVVEKTYFNVSNFWKDVNNLFDIENREVIIFAHNSQFDFKMLDGFTQLFKLDWKLTNHYVKNKTFILTFKKLLDGKWITLRIWDTMNYVAKKLEELGESVGYPKLEVDFNHVSEKDLIVYCKRDTEIVYKFIRKLIEFLETNNLSRLKPTAGSLSFNTFRHKFYNPVNDNQKIYIHDWKKAIKLERASYRGGITDCFKLGNYDNIYKLDINSMYPYVMRNELLPYKLVFYSHDSEYTQETLSKIYKISVKKGYGVIIRATITINENNAYILNKFKSGKSLFTYGTFECVLCLPELQFIEQNNGSIDYIHEINVYSMRYIFKEFVDFFYNKRLEYKEQGNLVNEQFCKLMLNTQYGKWGQRAIEYNEIKITDKFIIDYQEVIKLMFEKLKLNNPYFEPSKDIGYLGTILNVGELYLINGKLYLMKQTQRNSKESLVAISSFITSYARMMLVKYLKISNRVNAYYCDTDSLFVNNKGYNNLKVAGYIDKFQLGKLKKEGFGTVKIYAPKFYDFNNNRKCKGVNLKTATLISETKDKVIYQVELWQKFKTDLKKGNNREQIITKSIKEINKTYTKGFIDKDNIVHPFHVNEILEICS